MIIRDESGQNASVGEPTDEDRRFHTGPNGESSGGPLGKASNKCCQMNQRTMRSRIEGIFSPSHRPNSYQRS